jgi:hypothetical protein
MKKHFVFSSTVYFLLLKFRSSFLPAWQFPLVDLQRLKPKRLGIKLKDLQKPALYMCITGVHN